MHAAKSLNLLAFSQLSSESPCLDHTRAKPVIIYPVQRNDHSLIKIPHRASMHSPNVILSFILDYNNNSMTIIWLDMMFWFEHYREAHVVSEVEGQTICPFPVYMRPDGKARSQDRMLLEKQSVVFRGQCCNYFLLWEGTHSEVRTSGSFTASSWKLKHITHVPLKKKKEKLSKL